MSPAQIKAIVVAIAIAMLASVIAFGLGFIRLVLPQISAQAGVAIGVGSAAAWAMASVCRNQDLNNWFNLFAAMFAAASLGYLTPAETLCYRNGANWQGLHWATALPCRWTAAEPLAQDPEITAINQYLGKVAQFMRSQDSRLRNTMQRVDVLDNQQQTQRREVEQSLSDLQARIGRMGTPATRVPGAPP